MQVADSLLDLVGHTPLVRLAGSARDLDCDLIAKVEMVNPGGSVKDRPADRDDRRGRARRACSTPGGTIVEPTSGNTGVGLAIVAAQRGYRCIFVMSDKMSDEKVALLRAYGAEVVVCPTAVPPEHPDSYYSVADRLTREIPNAFRPNQYSNPANPDEHERSTGPEIWEQTAGRITHFVAGIGTGGTITGVARYLKRRTPRCRSSAPTPRARCTPAGRGVRTSSRASARTSGPTTYDPVARRPHGHGQRRRVVRRGAPRDARGGPADRRVVRHRGARRARGRRASSAPSDVVVVLLPDSGRGYLSKIFNDEWMMRLRVPALPTARRAGDVLEQRATRRLDPRSRAHHARRAGARRVRADARPRRLAAGRVGEQGAAARGRRR